MYRSFSGSWMEVDTRSARAFNDREPGGRLFAFIQRELQHQSTSVCCSSQCQLCQVQSNSDCPDVSPQIDGLILATHAWETAGLKTTHESDIDLIWTQSCFHPPTHIGRAWERIRNSPGVDIFNPDFPIEHRPFCSGVGTAIQNRSPIR